MFRKTLLRKKPASGCHDIHHFCTVYFLDDAEPLTVTFQKEAKGQEIFDQVCTSLDLIEKHYFGLRYIDIEKQRRWLDLMKPAHRQFKHVNPVVLRFRVKYYPSSPEKLKEEITKYFLFLQLRRDLSRGRLLCSVDQAVSLSAYIVQSELGDYEQESLDAVDYISQLKLMPKAAIGHELEIAEAHRSLKGQSPADVEDSFLRTASQLDMYGVDPHIVQGESGIQLNLGITYVGIVTLHGPQRTHLFKWPEVARLGYDGRAFIIHVVAPAEPKKRVAHSFKCPSLTACKNLWKCAVEQQYFFNLETAARAPKVSSGGLFRRHSTYRFSGRCENEAFAESSRISRMSPSVRRSTSSLQNVSAYNTLRAGSLPEEYFATRRSLDSSCSDGNVSNLRQFLVAMAAPDHIDLDASTSSCGLESGLAGDSIPEESSPVSTPPGTSDTPPPFPLPSTDPPVDQEVSNMLPCLGSSHPISPESMMPDSRSRPDLSVTVSSPALLDAVLRQRFVLISAIVLLIAAIALVYFDNVPEILNLQVPLRSLLTAIFALW